MLAHACEISIFTDNEFFSCCIVCHPLEDYAKLMIILYLDSVFHDNLVLENKFETILDIDLSLEGLHHNIMGKKLFVKI